MLQEEALKILKNGHNVFLTGAAGSGKTFLLNQYIQYLKSRKEQIGITASTGIAATHMEGMTIHSWAGIGLLRTASDKQIQDILDRKRVARRLRKARTLIIDEVSMLDAERIDLVERVTRYARGVWKPFGGLQVILCGDFFQLPPVAKAGEPVPGFAYQSAAWQNMDMRVCYLHEQYRQGDKELLKILNAIRDAEVDETVVDSLRRCRNTILAPGLQSRFVKLHTHNPDVDRENERELASLPGKANRYTMGLSGIPAIAEALKMGCLAPEKLLLKKGAAVMFVKNNFEEGYVNGTLGTVSGFNETGFPIVTLLNNQEILAEPVIWSVEENGKVLAQIKQIPLRLAWAITVHKSQGMTLDAAMMDLTRCFESGMGYVALSRVRSLAGLQLTGFNDIALHVSQDILAFDQELKKHSEEALFELNSQPGPVAVEEPAPEISTISKIRTKLPSAFKRWTADEEQKLIAGFKSGLSTTALSETLGRGEGGIRSRLKKLGLIDEDYTDHNPAT